MWSSSGDRSEWAIKAVVEMIFRERETTLFLRLEGSEK